MSQPQEFYGVVVYENTSENRKYFLFYSAEIDEQLRGYLVLPYSTNLRTGHWYRIRYHGDEQLSCFTNKPVPMRYISCNIADPPSFRDAVFRYIPNSESDPHNGYVTMIVKASVQVKPKRVIIGDYIRWFYDKFFELQDIVGPCLEAENIARADVVLEVYAAEEGWHVVRFLGRPCGASLHSFLSSCYFPLSVNGNCAYSVEDWKRWIATDSGRSHTQKSATNDLDDSMPTTSTSSVIDAPQSTYSVPARNTEDTFQIKSISRDVTSDNTYDDKPVTQSQLPKVVPTKITQWKPKTKRAENQQTLQAEKMHDADHYLPAPSSSLMKQTKSSVSNIAQQKVPETRQKTLEKSHADIKESEFPAVFERTIRLSKRSRSPTIPPTFSRISPSGEDEMDITAMIVTVQKKYVIAWTPQPRINSILIDMDLITDSPWEKKTNGLIKEGLWLKVKAAPRLEKDADIENKPFITHIASEGPRPIAKNFAAWKQRTISGRVEILAEFDTTDEDNVKIQKDKNSENVYILTSSSTPQIRVIAPYRRMHVNGYIDLETHVSKYRMRFWCTVKAYQPELDCSLYLLNTTPIELINDQSITIGPGRIGELLYQSHENGPSPFLQAYVNTGSSGGDSASRSQISGEASNSPPTTVNSYAVLESDALKNTLKTLSSIELQKTINEEGLRGKWDELLTMTMSSR